MIVVGAGSSTRFGADKLLTLVVGSPLITHTVRAVSHSVDRCVIVCRPDQMETIDSFGMGVELVAGGSTRTESEIAGLSHLSDSYDLIGIHDAARPSVSGALCESLFAAAARHGGAIPVVDVPWLVDRSELNRLTGISAAQTPQVFAASSLREAYRRAEKDGFEGYDTAQVVGRYSDITIKVVPGEPNNVKVTYPDDLRLIESVLEERVRSEPQ